MRRRRGAGANGGLASARTLAAAAAAVLAAFSAPADASPQAGSWRTGAGVAVETYSFSDPEATGVETLTLFTAPFAVELRLHPRLVLSAGGAWARGSLSREDGTSSTVSGPTDTRVGASWTLGEDRVVLSGAVFLPTGSATHSEEEAAVAGAIASDLLPFRISNWGTGGGADVSAAVAAPAGGFALGVRAGYRYVAEYEPLEDPLGTGAPFRYDPGDQVYVRLGADRNLGRAAKLSLSGTWQRFAEDVAAERNLFQTGDRLQVMGSLAFPWGRRGSGWAYAGVLHRGAGAFLTEFAVPEPPAEDVMFAGTGARVLLGGASLLPGVDLRVLRTDDGAGQGWTVGVGGSAELPLGEGPRLAPTARARFGRVMAREDVESGFVGFELGLTVRGVGR